LWEGLQEIHERNPDALAKLAGELERYRETHPLTDAQGSLFGYTVDGLQQIINPPEDQEGW
jgi:hypothetical protein